MVKAAAGAMACRAVKGERRGIGLAGVGSGGAETGCEDSVVPAGPRGWERREPMFCLLLFSSVRIVGLRLFGVVVRQVKWTSGVELISWRWEVNIAKRAWEL